jgi:hypothetical protein
VKKMVRKNVQANAIWWGSSERDVDDRVDKAQADGNTAALVFKNRKNIKAILGAIDHEDKLTFASTCRDSGITDPELIMRMWDATMGSLDPQSGKPCW